MNAKPDDHGASAVLIAFAMVLLLGMAAIAVDLGLGFNERRQSQTAADVAVMAGAVEIVQGSAPAEIVDEVLTFAEANLNATYAPADWQSAWQNCTDPERLGFDVGIGTPVDFQPMPSPWGGELECISHVSSYLRVRIPDQFVQTSFARVIGTDQLSTHADAVAKIDQLSENAIVVPFGIPGNTANGEICLKSSGSGTAFPPCQGPTAGGFGEINSEFFGDFFGSPTCSNPGATELAQNVALGIDHALTIWPNGEGVAAGSPHPGDFGIGGVSDYEDVGFDACRIQSGAVVPEYADHVTPPNTMRVGTGFSPQPIEDGLISDLKFMGENSRLQQGDNDKRRIHDKGMTYDLDNKGLWDYLNPTNGVAAECDGNTYSGLTIDQKVARMSACLSSYGGGPTLFTDDLDESPRLVWAPEYWHAASTSGSSWQPIREFRLVFIAGTWFNCSSGTCDDYFYPDISTTGDMCITPPASCKAIGLDQLSAYLLPIDAVPDTAIPPMPGTSPDLMPTLFK